MVIIVMFWRTFGKIVFIYINGNALKCLKSPREKSAARVFLYKCNKQLQYFSF